MDVQKDLDTAIRMGSIPLVNSSIEAGADVNQLYDGISPLCLAIQNGEEPIVLKLLESGANVTIEIKEIPRERNISLKTWLRAIAQEVTANAATHFILKLLASSNHLPARLKPILTASTGWNPSAFRIKNSLAYTLFLQHFESLKSERQHRHFFTLRELAWHACVYVGATHTNGTTRAYFEACQRWTIKGSLIKFTILVLGEAAFHFILGWRERAGFSPAPAIVPRNGEAAVNAVTAFGGNGEQMMVYLLEHGIFSREIVAKEYNDPVSKVWCWASQNGHLRVITTLINMGIDVDRTPRPGHMSTALCYAAGSAHAEAVRILLSTKPNVEGYANNAPRDLLYWSDTPLLSAASGLAYNRWESEEASCSIIRQLLGSGANVNAVNSSGRSSLSLAAEYGSIRAVEILLEHGADPNLLDRDGKSALHYPVFFNNDSGRMVKMLIDYGSNIQARDKDNTTPLIEIVRNESNVVATKLLLIAGADPTVISKERGTALQNVSLYGSVDIIEALIDAGADVNAAGGKQECPLLIAASRNHDAPKMVLFFLEKGARANSTDKKGRTALHEMARYYKDKEGSFLAAKALLDHRADVNAVWTGGPYGRGDVTPLGLAVDSQNDRFAKLLREHGAEQNPQKRIPLLHEVCGSGHSLERDISDEIEALLAAGAEINVNGSTALHYAARANNFHAVRVLLQHHVDVNVLDAFGRTPLHLACSDKHWNETLVDWNSDRDCRMSQESNLTLGWLFRYDAKPHLQDSNGATPLHIAARVQNARIAASLLLHAARPLLEIRDHKGRLALHYAARYGAFDVMLVLLQYETSEETNHHLYQHVTTVSTIADEALQNIRTTHPEYARVVADIQSQFCYLFVWY